MTIHYDIETDGLYLEGMEKGIGHGIELNKREFIQKLWSLQEFSLEKMAFLIDISVERLSEVIVEILQKEGFTVVEAQNLIERYRAKFSKP